MVARKNVGTEIHASDNPLGGKLQPRPPLRIDQHLLAEPIRNELLASLFVSELPELGGELCLAAACEFDDALERNNVVSLHKERKYTRNLVDVNKFASLTTDKDVCTVLDMTSVKRKAKPSPAVQAKRKRAPEPEVGPDGRTLAQRVILLMSESRIGQSDLARMCSAYYATFYPTIEEPKVKQQHIFNLLQGQASSAALPLIAAVFDVSDIWLQYGIGPKERGPKH